MLGSAVASIRVNDNYRLSQLETRIDKNVCNSKQHMPKRSVSKWHVTLLWGWFKSKHYQLFLNVQREHKNMMNNPSLYASYFLASGERARKMKRLPPYSPTYHQLPQPAQACCCCLQQLQQLQPAVLQMPWRRTARRRERRQLFLGTHHPSEITTLEWTITWITYWVSRALS